jgi:hypothetical protein
VNFVAGATVRDSGGFTHELNELQLYAWPFQGPLPLERPPNIEKLFHIFITGLREAVNLKILIAET